MKGSRITGHFTLLAVTFVLEATASACPAFRPAVDEVIYGDDYWRNVGIALLPFIVIALVTVLVERLSTPSPNELDRRG